MSTHEEREKLERRADFVRDRLATTLEALDARRHEIMDPIRNPKQFLKQNLRQNAKLVGIIGGGIAFAIGATVWAGVMAAKNARHRRQVERKNAIVRLWKHPERVAVRSKEKPFYVQIMQKLVMSALTVAVGRLAGIAAKKGAQRTPSDAPRALTAQRGVVMPT